MRYPKHTTSPVPWKLKTRNMGYKSENGNPMRACEIVDANGRTVMGEYPDDDGSVYADFRLIVKAVNTFSSENIRKKMALATSSNVDTIRMKASKKGQKKGT